MAPVRTVCGKYATYMVVSEFTIKNERKIHTRFPNLSNPRIVNAAPVKKEVKA